jgi:hypothetical protein
MASGEAGMLDDGAGGVLHIGGRKIAGWKAGGRMKSWPHIGAWPHKGG